MEFHLFDQVFGTHLASPHSSSDLEAVNESEARFFLLVLEQISHMGGQFHPSHKTTSKAVSRNEDMIFDEFCSDQVYAKHL